MAGDGIRMEGGQGWEFGGRQGMKGKKSDKKIDQTK
jgi:hypothetical protein